MNAVHTRPYSKSCLILDSIAILLGTGGIVLVIINSSGNAFWPSLIGCSMMILGGFIGLEVGYYRRS